MAKLDEIKIDGTTVLVGGSAEKCNYDNTQSGIDADNVQDAIDLLAAGVPASGDYSAYGTFGTYFPKQIDIVNGILDKNKWTRPRLRFMHTSDNHGSTLAYIDDLADVTGANFIVVTGDILYDHFSNSYETPLACLTKPTKKPSFITLGNHDVAGTGYYEQDGTTWTYTYDQEVANQLRYDKFFAPLKTHNESVTYQPDAGGIVVDKTYYYVDYSDEKVRCIFLDNYDAMCSGTAGNYVICSMSSNQIVWLIGLLQGAITNGYHVAIFAHQIPFKVSMVDGDWYDYNYQREMQSSVASMLCGIVEAFRTGGTYTYGGTDYTFSSSGAFIGWFTGHDHMDRAGWGDGYTHQFGCTVCCPGTQGTNYCKLYRGYPNSNTGAAANYVTIDTTWRYVTIYRLGNQMMYNGRLRTAISYLY